MAEALIRDVSDTAFWIAHHRATETQRADALFRDPLAARLAGERGRDIALAMPAAAVTEWMVALRTVIIDAFIEAAIDAGTGTILNLGAGLDTRPYRMQLPPGLRWIEADHPRIIDYKENLLSGEKPNCLLERVRIDLAERGPRLTFLARVDATSPHILVLTEGVIPYLSVRDAGELADNLHRLTHVRHWIVDYFSAQAIRMRKRSSMGRVMRNSPFRFEPADWFGFFREHGWHPAEIRYLAEEGEKFGRGIPVSGVLKALMVARYLLATRAQREQMRRFAGYVLLKPVDSADR